MEDKILITLCTDANHTLECASDIIGREGEGNTTQLSVTIPNALSGHRVYLDFEKPNGEKIRTPELELDSNDVAIYDVVPYLLTDDGLIKVQAVLISEEGQTWKSSKKKFRISKSINAIEEIPDRDAFMVGGQQLLEDLRKESADLAERNEAENARKEAEIARADAEIARADAETARVDGEIARAEAEIERASAEKAREDAETARVEAEEARNRATEEVLGTLANFYATPEMFGAVGDGVIDDTVAIKSAINSADCVKFDPTKTYKVSGNIYLKNNTHLEGRGATIYGGSFATQTPVFCVLNVSNVVIDNLTIKGDNNVLSEALSGTSTIYTSNLVGIHMQKASNISINNCIFDGLRYAVKQDEAVVDVPSSYHITVDSCTTQNGVIMPFYFGGALDVHITRCDIDAVVGSKNTNHNVYISASCDDVFFTNNHFSGGSGFCFNIGTSASNATPPKDILIHNNICECASAFLANIHGANVTLTGNVITTNATRSFYLAAKSVLAMSGNHIQASNSEGNAYVFEGTDVTIRSTSDVITCDALILGVGGVSDVEFSNCVLTCKSNTISVGYLTSTSTSKLRCVACTFYTYLTGGSEIGKPSNAQQMVSYDRCTFYNATPKSIAFATNANCKQFYLLNCVFLGFSQLDYSNPTTGTVHNTVVLPIASAT